MSYNKDVFKKLRRTMGKDAALAVATDIASGSTGSAKDVSLTSPNTDYVQKVTVVDDNSATAGWANRFEWFFRAFGGSARLTTYINEYGELRAIPAKANTVALRVYSKETSGDTNHSGNFVEFCDDRDNRTVLLGVSTAGVTLKGFPPSITVGTTAPASPATNAVWIDIS